MANKKYIQLPHHHLSYSQMRLWLDDPQKYKKIYFDNRDELRTSNAGQEYGKMVATALENRADTGDLLTDSAMLLLPKYEVADEAINVETKTKWGWLALIAKPDTFDSNLKAFREYKTGRHPWTQRKAQEHLQMIFYATVIWLKYGVKLPGAHLDWIETERVDGVTRPTGRVESFPVTFAPTDYPAMLARMVKVALEIQLAWIAHVPDKRHEEF